MSKKRKWIWYFVALLILGATAVTIPIVYNLNLQLTEEKVESAREAWERQRINDYDLRYRIRFDDDKFPDEYVLRVRDGEVRNAWQNGKEILSPGTEEKVLTVDQIFDLIEANLESDLSPEKRRNYATAQYHPKWSYPIRYIRRVRGSRERLEITAKLTLPHQSDN